MSRKKVWPPRVYVHRPSNSERVRIDGKDIYLGPAGSDEAKSRYVEILAQVARPQPQQQQEPVKKKRATAGGGTLTVAEAVARFHKHAKERYSERGREAEQFRRSLAPLVELHGQTPVIDFGVTQLDEVRERMIALGWNRSVINRRMVRVRTAWRWCERAVRASRVGC